MSKLPVQWPTPAKRWLLAVSGGLDSMCLLHLAYQLQQTDSSTPLIEVVHVNHGLQEQAGAWQLAVEQQAQAYGFTCHSRQVSITSEQIQQAGVEAAARYARYAVFASLLEAGDVLLLAQHADDQAETFFLRLLRGAGVAGLGAMPQQRVLGEGELWRPLLKVSRQQLQAYAHQHQLSWVNDPSNQDLRYDRNYLRHSVLPALYERWPSLSQRVQITSDILQETQSLLQEVGESDLHACVVDDAVLSIHSLLQLSSARRNNVLRLWLGQCGENSLSHGMLQRLNSEVILASEDGQPSLSLGFGEVKRSYGKLHWLGFDSAVAWQAPQQLVWSEELAQQQAVAFAGGWLVPTNKGMRLQLGDRLVATKRQGGERCQPVGRGHSQSLKKLLQEYQVPAWQRASLPLIYRNNELAMVANLWVCEGCAGNSSATNWRWLASLDNND